MAGAGGRDAQFVKHQQDHVDERIESPLAVLFLRDIRQHDITLIGIDAAAAALPSIHLYVMLTAVVHVHLVLHHLVAAEDDAGLHLPHEETVWLIGMASHIFLHRQIERQPAHHPFPSHRRLAGGWRIDRQNDVLHSVCKFMNKICNRQRICGFFSQDFGIMKFLIIFAEK